MTGFSVIDSNTKFASVSLKMEQLHDINEEIERMINDIEKNEKLVTEYTDKATAAEKEKEDLKCQIAKIQRKLDEGEADRRQKERQLQAEKSVRNLLFILHNLILIYHVRNCVLRLTVTDR